MPVAHPQVGCDFSTDEWRQQVADDPLYQLCNMNETDKARAWLGDERPLTGGRLQSAIKCFRYMSGMGIRGLSVACYSLLVKSVANSGGDLDGPGGVIGGLAPMHALVVAGRAEHLSVLIQAGGDVETRLPVDGHTPLTYSMRFRSLECMRVLLDATADPNQADSLHMTPLIWAVSAEVTNAIPILLQAGADPTLCDRDGMSAVRLAFVYNNHGAIEAFREGGLKMDWWCGYGEYLLDQCARVGQPLELEQFIVNGGDVLSRDPATGRTLLHSVAAYECPSNDSLDHTMVSCARVLLRAGCGLDEKDAEGKTPRDLAVTCVEDGVRGAVPRAKFFKDCHEWYVPRMVMMMLLNRTARLKEEDDIAVLLGTLSPLNCDTLNEIISHMKPKSRYDELKEALFGYSFIASLG